MSEELKKCPFCGGNAQLDHREYGVSVFSLVRCTSCGARIKEFHISTSKSSDAEAIEAWNRRAEDE